MTKLRCVRLKRKMKLREVAEIVKVTAQNVGRMEMIGIRKASTAQKYAEALACSWQDLIDDPLPADLEK